MSENCGQILREETITKTTLRKHRCWNIQTKTLNSFYVLQEVKINTGEINVKKDIFSRETEHERDPQVEISS